MNNLKVRILLYLLASLLSFSSHAESFVSIDIDSNNFTQRISENAYFFYDENDSETLNSINSKFREGSFNQQNHPNMQFGYKQGSYWIAFKVKHKLLSADKYYLEFKYPPLDYINIYLFKDDILIDERQGGDRLPYSGREYQTRYHLFSFDLTPNSEYLFFIKTKTESSYSLPVQLSSEVAYVTQQHMDQVALGIYYGICLGLFFYNLFLYFTIREKIYLKYLSYVLCHTLFTASLDGLLYQLWPEATIWESRAVYITAWSTGFFLMIFCNEFLHLEESMPLAHKISTFVALVFLAGVIAFNFIPISFAAKVNPPMVIIAVIIMFSFTIKRYRQGYRPAGYFLIGMGSFLIGSALIATGSTNISNQYDLAPVFFKFGAAMEMFCFSIGLGHRINSLKSEQAQASREAEIAKTESLARKRYAQEMEQINRQLNIAMQARSDFLANMSHEIRTPMNGVLGMLELVGDTKLSKEQQNYINVARRSGTTLLTLINDILDLSKIEAGKLELEKIDFNLKQVVEDLKNLFNVQLHDKNLSFEHHYQNNLTEWVRGDRTRVWQILTNLIGNAIKFTSEGGITVSIKKNEKLFLVSVTDTGIGISEEAQEKIFESFTQADSSTTRKFGGTGLGLTISRKLANVMGGDISVSSVLGEGTTFTLLMDLEEISAPEIATNISKDGVVQESCYGMTALLAEDNIVNQQVANGIFKKLGVDIDIVNDGAEAVNQAHQKTYDLIFMDVQMPNMDGYEATKVIKSANGPNLKTPIIAMTANAMQGDKEKCLQEGMDDYLSKPFQKNQLRKIMVKWKKLKNVI